MFAIVFVLLVIAQSDHAGLQVLPESRAAYQAIKANPKPALSDAERLAALEPNLVSALARRGHSGDRAYLQGCDLFDASTSYDEANQRLIEASGAWEEYVALWEDAFPDHDYARRVFEGTPEQVAKLRARADQRARGPITETLPGGVLGSAVMDLRLINQCAVDRPNSEWLQASEAWRMFQTSDDREVLTGLYYLAMHADDRPHLQTRFAEIYEGRRRSLNWPVEPGLRLIDRAAINLGHPQPYATAVLCEEGQPVFAGKVELEAANARRIAVGLPPQDLGEKSLNGFCGSANPTATDEVR